MGTGNGLRAAAAVLCSVKPVYAPLLMAGVIPGIFHRDKAALQRCATARSPACGRAGHLGMLAALLKIRHDLATGWRTSFASNLIRSASPDILNERTHQYSETRENPFFLLLRRSVSFGMAQLYFSALTLPPLIPFVQFS